MVDNHWSIGIQGLHQNWVVDKRWMVWCGVGAGSALFCSELESLMAEDPSPAVSSAFPPVVVAHPLLCLPAGQRKRSVHSHQLSGCSGTQAPSSPPANGKPGWIGKSALG